MTEMFLLFLGGMIGGILVALLAIRLRSNDVGSPVTPPDGHAGKSSADIYTIAEAAEDYFDRSAHPDDLHKSHDFNSGVSLLSSDQFSTDGLFSYVEGSNTIISCMALKALAERSLTENDITRLIDSFHRQGLWELYFAVQLVKQYSNQPRLEQILANIQEWWLQHPLAKSIFDDLLNSESAKGHSLVVENALNDLKPKTITALLGFLQEINTPAALQLKADAENWKKQSLNTNLLHQVGRLWGNEFVTKPLVVYAEFQAYAERVKETLLNPPVRSVIVVGPDGAGKSSLIRFVAQAAQQQGWQMFESTAGEVIAGQKYVGEIEGRVKDLLNTLGNKKRVIWYMPDIYEAVAAGSYRGKPRGVLDLLLPAIERGELIMVGDATPEAYQHLIQERTQIKNVFETVILEPVSETRALYIAREWSRLQGEQFGAEIIDDAVLNEAQALVTQYLYNTSAPGNILQLLAATINRLAASETEHLPVSKDDLLQTLSQLTHIPVEILDDRRELNLSQLRDKFHRRLVGQEEAVDCLLERISMIKAGVTNPTRPLGVFLFAGPTGTGKTEIAKSLAEILFGSERHMIRLDMSEYQGSDSSWRLLQEDDPALPSKSLVTRVRQQPFSVVLLDEFEKSHPNVWDLFLQVFDDGRLSDRLGNTVSFRHTIIILTSNLGATVSGGTSIGFSQDKASFSPSSVNKAIDRTFRREFVNRLDRIVIFNPLTRGVMREILNKELSAAFQRQGLRNRGWAVEIDESAVDFLLNKGFTVDLGARPLQRAIEQYVLAPLAMSIVERRFPHGDQFLFLRRNNERLEAQFIDPDSPEPLTEERDKEAAATKKPELDLRRIALESVGMKEELDFLDERLTAFAKKLEESDWRESKQSLLDAIAGREFWESDGRFEILAQVEFMDRVESGCESAQSIMNRLTRGKTAQHQQYPAEMVRRLAEQLYLLEAAYQDFKDSSPKDAFLQIGTSFEAGKSPNYIQRTYQQLIQMYQSWAKRRRMTLRMLVDHCDDKGQCQGLLAISGFGAYRILQQESGLHVFEYTDNKNHAERYSVKVRVAPQLVVPPEKQDLEQQAIQQFSVQQSAPVVVRRYVAGSAPLVKDYVRNWRTGRFNRVLEGNFDLL